MKSYNSKDKFKDILSNSHYLRVDAAHPIELRIGKNDSGQKSLRFIGVFQPSKIKSTRSIEVKHSKFGEKLGLTLSLIDDTFEDIYYLLCNDLIDSTRNISQDSGYTFIVNRFEKWRGFTSSNRKHLSEHEIKGLIGELLFLKNFLFEKYGESKSISGWTGTEPLKKDYSFDDTWYEVKVTTGDKFTISSIEQLESDSVGYLILYILEKVSSETEALTINKIIEGIKSDLEISIDLDMFVMKLLQAGYVNEEHYEQYKYKLKQTSIYKVTKEFPKISRENLSNAISNVKYDLIINLLNEFQEEKI